MQKYITLFILSLLLFTSCNEIFHEQDNELIVLDKREEKINALNAIYSLLVTVHNEEYCYALCRSDDINFYSNASFTGGGIFPANMPTYSIGNRFNVDLTIEYVSNIYGKLYSAIITANSIIVSSNESDSDIHGEALFLRAYCYFKLARFFGTPPIVDDIEVDFTLPKPTTQEVYEFIENDLLASIKYLPEQIEKARIPQETPFVVTAKALLAEVYLTMAGYPTNDASKYEAAATLAEEVINSENFSLIDDLADLWKEKYSHNNENIFGLYFNPESSIQDNSLKNNFNTTLVQRWETTTGKYNYHFLSWNCPEFKFFNDFPENYRKYISINSGYYTRSVHYFQDSLLWSTYYYETNLFNNPQEYIENTNSLKFIHSDSFANNQNEFNFSYGSNLTLYLLRYAHTLLTYAEAKAHIGEPDKSAYQAINQIKRRANKVNIYEPSPYDLSPNLSPDQFIDSVIWERAWELCMEPDGRWFDIVRLHLLDKLNTEYRYSQDYPTIIPDDELTPDGYFYKIPQKDRWINPNLE